MGISIVTLAVYQVPPILQAGTLPGDHDGVTYLYLSFALRVTQIVFLRHTNQAVTQLL